MSSLGPQAELRSRSQHSRPLALGVERVEFLGYEDGEVEDSRQLRRDVTRQIRRWRPDLIITQNPNRTYTNFYGWHRDHRIAAGVVLDCVYPLARDHLAFTELLPESEPHKVGEVYLIQWDDPQMIVDTSDTMALKLKALACHASQFADFSATETRLCERAAALGKANGYTYAEGFDRIVLPG